MDNSKTRIYSIDIARGIIMVIMALDHVRDYIHINTFDPTDLNKTSTALFLTRWITHFCMPTFVLLSGVAIYLNLHKKSKREISLYLLTRGLWLILLEVTVMRFILLFNFYYDDTLLGVLWLFGVCMILFSALIFLSNRTLLVLGLMITLGHDLLYMINVDGSNPFSGLWTLFVTRGVLMITPNNILVAVYPVLPWLGVMLLGYSLGQLYTNMDQEKRIKKLIRFGAIAIISFVVLRFLNVYGDIFPWSTQKNEWYTFLSFLNTTKYPVSLLFILMTIGPLFLLLAILEKTNLKWASFFLPIGRVPLFYFIVHFFLIHVAALSLSILKTGTPFSEIDLHFAKSFGGLTSESKISLPWVYVFWFCIIMIMNPLCRWYDSKKTGLKKRWMSYL